MSLEGSGAAEKKVSDVAREVINQAYDVFGREKTSVERTKKRGGPTGRSGPCGRATASGCAAAWSGRAGTP